MSAALGCPVAGCAGTATWPVLTVLLPWAAGDVAGLCPNDSEAITATAKRVVRNREGFMGPILCSAGTRRQARKIRRQRTHLRRGYGVASRDEKPEGRCQKRVDLFGVAVGSGERSDNASDQRSWNHTQKNYDRPKH